VLTNVTTDSTLPTQMMEAGAGNKAEVQLHADFFIQLDSKVSYKTRGPNDGRPDGHGDVVTTEFPQIGLRSKSAKV
jgi:hypothetical protein